MKTASGMSATTHPSNSSKARRTAATESSITRYPSPPTAVCSSLCLRNAKPPIMASTTTGMIELVRNGSTILFGMRPSKSSRKCTGRTPRTTSPDTRASVGIERYRPGVSVLASVERDQHGQRRVDGRDPQT